MTNPINRFGILAAATAAALTLAACSSANDGEPASEDTATPRSDASSEGADTTSSATPKSTAPSAPATGTAGTPITITAGGRAITATLNDSDVSQDFIETLPVTLPWYRNYDIEFITELAAPMTETGPFYTDVQPGDLVYYNPMDSITVIYEETSSVPTLTKMGEVTSDLDVFRSLPDDIEMRVELG